MMAARNPALAAWIAAFWPAGPDPTQRKSKTSGCTLQPRQGAYGVAFLEHAPPVIGKYAQLLEHRTVHDPLLVQQMRMQGMRGQQMRRVHRSRQIAVLRFPVVAPIAGAILHVLGQVPRS